MKHIASNQEWKLHSGAQGQTTEGPVADRKPSQQFLHVVGRGAPADGTSAQMPQGNWVSGTEPGHGWPIVWLICALLRGSSPLQRMAAHPALDMDVKWLAIRVCAQLSSWPGESLLTDKS